MFAKNSFFFVEGILVVLDSLENYQGHALEAQALEISARVGGAVGVRYATESFGDVIKMTRDLKIPFLTSVTGVMEPGKPMISMTWEFFKDHSEEEFLALLYHEVGHIKAGHLDREIGEGGIIDNEDFEIEADAYASVKTSKEAMFAGFMKTVEAQCHFMSIVKNHSPEKAAKTKKKVLAGVAATRRVAAMK